VVFTAGLFTIIAVAGAACTLLGRMPGDLGAYFLVRPFTEV